MNPNEEYVNVPRKGKGLRGLIITVVAAILLIVVISNALVVPVRTNTPSSSSLVPWCGW